MFNPTNKQFEVYLQKTGTITPADTTSNINPGLYTGSASNMIASGQAFFILANTSNQTISFRETAKTNTQPSTAQLNTLMGVPKGTPVANDPLIRLQLIQDSTNTDEIVVQLNDQTSRAYSSAEDALDIGSIGATVSLSTVSSDQVKLAIDKLPFPKRSPQVVPLYVDATSAGAYKLQLGQLSNLSPVYQVILRDHYLQDSVIMNQGTAYSFNIDKSDSATFAGGRFQLVISPGPQQTPELVSFSAEKSKGASLIRWRVKNESNTTAFYVERSLDNGRTFLPIGSLQSTGAGSYDLVDRTPVGGEGQ